jgi:hypothetical protein
MKYTRTTLVIQVYIPASGIENRSSGGCYKPTASGLIIFSGLVFRYCLLEKISGLDRSTFENRIYIISKLSVFLSLGQSWALGSSEYRAGARDAVLSGATSDQHDWVDTTARQHRRTILLEEALLN